MENFVEKKYLIVSDIKSRYLPQIKELETQKSEVVELVVENLKSQMNEEIANEIIKLEEMKKAQIIELKRQASES